jgi:hypothetical protein
MKSFEALFNKATAHSPYQYQVRLAENSSIPKKLSKWQHQSNLPRLALLTQSAVSLNNVFIYQFIIACIYKDLVGCH